MITTPAQAIVEPLDKDSSERWWRVIVKTPPGWPRFIRKVYYKRAWTESQAGQLGLHQFAQDVDHRPQGQIWMG